MGTSKTARRSTPRGPKQTFRREGRRQWVTPLGGGTYARILDPNSAASRHVAVNSEAFESAIRDVVAAGGGDDIRAELETFGWTDVLARLEQAGAFTIEEPTEAA